VTAGTISNRIDPNRLFLPLPTPVGYLRERDQIPLNLPLPRETLDCPRLANLAMEIFLTDRVGEIQYITVKLALTLP
jgi:hypothetical protein